FQNCSLFLILGMLLFLIRPAILGEVNGTLKTAVVPNEYKDLKDFLINDATFSRVLWVPTLSRFTFYSDTHPAISGRDFIQTSDPFGVIKYLQEPSTESLLQDASVRYIIVPDDTGHEIFIKDRMYDPT